jgi:hypothetical protein
MKLQKGQIESTNNTIDVLRNINGEKKELLDKNVGFDSLYTLVVQMNHDIENFNRLDETFLRVNALTARVGIKTGELSSLESLLSKLDFMSVKKDYLSLMDCGALVASLEERFLEVNKKTTSVLKLKDTLKDTNNLLSSRNVVVQEFRDSLDHISSLDTQIRDISETVGTLNMKQRKWGILSSSLNTLESTLDSIKIKSLKTTVKSLETLSTEFDDLKVLMGNLESKQGVLRSKVSVMDKTSDEYLEAFRVFEDFKVSVGVCPYCQSALVEECLC